MYDYMKALQKRFDRQEYPELAEQIEYAQAELRRDMDAAGRKKLLRLLDAQNALLVESKLISFTAGFKLAWGMAKELEADGLYSFEKEEEEHIRGLQPTPSPLPWAVRSPARISITAHKRPYRQFYITAITAGQCPAVIK